MVDDQIKLLALQQTLEQESLGKSFVGLSINETIRACLVGSLSKRADKVRSDFKVPDKRCASFHSLLIVPVLKQDPELGSGTSR